jgi:hypothetical protein
MDNDLDQVFDELNSVFFEGRLPKYRVRRCEPHGREHGFIDNTTATIWICASPEPRQTLLHEMCHIGTPGHGRLFRAQLRRLARRGETWAQAERIYYLREEIGMKANGWITLWEVAYHLRGGLSVSAI